MAYFRISTVSANVSLNDLGYVVVHPATNFVISNQFSIEDLQNSADLQAAIIGGSLTAEVNLDGSWSAVNAANFSGDEVYAAAANIYEIVTEVNNEELVDGSDTSLHNHDGMYYTETELSGVGGADLVGVDDTGWTYIAPAATTQEAFDNIDSMFGSFDLDGAYTNDTDGILDVDDSGKALNLRSDNANDILISRTDGVTSQTAMLFDVSANELILGDAQSGALAQIDVHVTTNLIVDGNITFTGTITDTTVSNMNVSNAQITLREGAITDANANLLVNRPVAGTDASLLWDETADRWKAGLEGSEQTIALLEADEIVTGVWEFQGGAASEPSMYLTDKASAPSTNLGTASQIPLAMINNTPAYYDKSNSRNKFLSMYRECFVFNGRDSANNTNEYARVGLFTSNQAGIRLEANMTLLSMSIQTTGAESWTAEVRKNDTVTVQASLAAVAASGAQVTTLNVDFNAGDEIQVYINGSNIDRPVIKLVFAERF